MGGNCVFDRANGRVSRRRCVSSKVFVRRLKQWTGRVVFDVKVKMDCAPPTVAIASAVTTIAAFASTAFESAPSGSLPAAASSYSSHEFKLWARNRNVLDVRRKRFRCNRIVCFVRIWRYVELEHIPHLKHELRVCGENVFRRRYFQMGHFRCDRNERHVFASLCVQSRHWKLGHFDCNRYGGNVLRLECRWIHAIALQ